MQFKIVEIGGTDYAVSTTESSATALADASWLAFARVANGHSFDVIAEYAVFVGDAPKPIGRVGVGTAGTAGTAAHPDPDAQCREHGCANWRCAEEHK